VKPDERTLAQTAALEQPHRVRDVIN